MPEGPRTDLTAWAIRTCVHYFHLLAGGDREESGVGARVDERQSTTKVSTAGVVASIRTFLHFPSAILPRRQEVPPPKALGVQDVTAESEVGLLASRSSASVPPVVVGPGRHAEHQHPIESCQGQRRGPLVVPE